MEGNNKTNTFIYKDKKLQVHIILRANEILLAHPKINKMRGTVMLVYMNVVNNYALQPSNVRAQHSKWSSVR